MPDSFTVTVERPELWLVTFDNPPLNKVDPEMILELQSARRAARSRSRRQGRGLRRAPMPEHFLGPYDMTRAADTPSEPGPTGLPPWLDLTVRLARLPVVSIAVYSRRCPQVWQRVRASRPMYGSPASSGRPSEQIGVHVGYGPGGGAVPRLPALIGRARTLEVILGSQPFNGAMAERYGLVNRALPDSGELNTLVATLASDIAGANSSR